MANNDVAAVRAAALDGRAQTVFYKLTQLEKLHEQLVKRVSELQDAIVADHGVTPGEAKIEYALAVDAVKRRYKELDATVALEKEYMVANKQNARERRAGVGLVVVKPSTAHSFLFSTIAPLAAAIAGGNVVVIQIENNTRQLPDAIKRAVKAALDPDSVAFTSTAVKEDGPTIFVHQEDSAKPAPHNHRTSASNGISIAVVDRNVDYDLVARALINARYAYRGTSPHAPDLILVNEFAKKDFLQALVRAGISSDEHPTEKPSTTRTPHESALKALISDLQSNLAARVTLQSSSGAVLEVSSRSPSLFRKITSPALLVHPTKSLDDAIDLVNSSGASISAGFYFTSPAAGKYLSQFIPAQASFINHVPPQILVGPAFVQGYTADPLDRYATDMFTVPAPAYIVPDEQAVALEKAGLTAGQAERDRAVAELHARALEALGVKKRQKQLNAGFGFFEQAFGKGSLPFRGRDRMADL